MRRGIEILENQVGKVLQDGIIQSYVFDGELSQKIHVVFLKFDQWIQIVTKDLISITEINSEKPELIGWVDDDGTTFEFPQTNMSTIYPEFDYFKNQRLIRFTELVDSEYPDYDCGLKLVFENQQTIITWSNKNDKTFIQFNDQIPMGYQEKIVK